MTISLKAFLFSYFSSSYDYSYGMSASSSFIVNYYDSVVSLCLASSKMKFGACFLLSVPCIVDLSASESLLMRLSCSL